MRSRTMFPGDATRGCHVAHDFPVATIQAEGNPQPFAVPSGDLDDIGTPPRIASVPADRAAMNPSGFSRVPLQKKSVDLHDPAYALVIYRGAASFSELSVQDRRRPPVSAACPFVRDLSDEEVYLDLDTLQIDLGEYMRESHEEGAHQGRRCLGRSPMQTPDDGKKLFAEKDLEKKFVA